MQRRPKRVGPYCRSQFSTLFSLLSRFNTFFMFYFSGEEIEVTDDEAEEDEEDLEKSEAEEEVSEEEEEEIDDEILKGKLINPN